MVKTEDINNRRSKWPNPAIDEEGNYECVRCGWTHTVKECVELRLVHANRELEKVNQFVQMIAAAGHEGETPVDTLIRAYRKHADQTEVTELLKEE